MSSRTVDGILIVSGGLAVSGAETVKLDQVSGCSKPIARRTAATFRGVENGSITEDSADGRVGPRNAKLRLPSLRGALATKHPFFLARRDGLLRGACHRARIRATRWLAMTASLTGLHRGRLAPTDRAPESFRHHDNLSAETAPKTSRSSGQRRRNRIDRPASLFSSPAAPCRSP